ncbi:MAG: DUF2752 domain-containing protein [Planctomycetaceae bacterium]|nr:DUF2752 domain-containing protein [Planctomycetaceae bacterium]
MSVESASPEASSSTTTESPSLPPKRLVRPDPLYHTVILVICVGVLVLSLLLSVREETQVLVPVLGVPLPELCMFRRLTGLGCPGCGMTRCFISLAHGDLRMAWHYNPAGPLLFAMLAFQIPFRLVQLARIRSGRPELRMGRWPQWFFGLLGVLLIGQWILRLCGITF